jgi:hypothetical protein
MFLIPFFFELQEAKDIIDVDDQWRLKPIPDWYFYMNLANLSSN